MTTVVELLQRRAEERPADRAFVFLDDSLDDGEAAVSYAELDAAARRVAAAVSARVGAGEPVLLLYPPGRAYVEGFLGCLYAGAIAVPAYPPDPTRPARTLPRLRGLLADCGAKLALGVSWLVDALPQIVTEATELAALDWIVTGTLAEDPSWTPSRRDADSPALLQYTSGSTGAPKGVLLSHANLVHNAGLVCTGFGTSPAEIGLSWLPPYHDMGLIGGILQPIYAGMTTVLMSPLAFLQRPTAWLEAISRFGATMSGGPNFAFDLCVRKSTPEQRASLDLSRWKLAFCGAEQVRVATLDRFAAAFACAGFRREAFYPCYGLAEATLIVTGGRPRRPIRHGDTVHVGCGTALGNQRVVIVDPAAGTACPPGTVGEIWVSGPSVARGYWRRPDDTARTFQARLAGDHNRYLRTGDLGLLTADGELVITGRIKDLIVVRGRNVYPQDLEQPVEERVAGVRPGCSAAFAVEVDGEERVAIACEVSGDGPTADAADTVAAIRQVLAEAAEVSPAAVVLMRPRTIPKTSSGKIQRHACRRAFVAGELSAGRADVVARWDEWSASQGDASKYHHYGEDGPLTTTIARVLGLPGQEIDPDAPLTRLGLDSMRAVELRHALDEQLGLDVPLSELLAGITVARLAGRATRTEHIRPPDAAIGQPGVSDGQRALWFLQQWAPDSTAYQITRAARIRSQLDPGALERALRTLVRRHPALHTRLPSQGGEPVARPFDWDGPVLERHDVTGLDDDALRQRVHRDAQRRFDLERGALLRVSLYSRGRADHVLLLSVHHVVADFWSLSVLVEDLLKLYRSELDGVPAQLPELPEMPATAGTTGIEARLDHWRATLAGAPAAPELPTTFPRPRLQSFRGAAHTFRVDPATVRELDALARQAGVTRFVTLLAGFAALLARYTGEDVVVGTPTAGREDRRTAHAVGYLVNPVPLRIRVEPGTPFRALLAGVRQVLLGALDNVVPFPRLVEAVQPARDPSRSPVMQVMLALQQAPPGRPDLAPFVVADDSARMRIGELDVQPYRLADHGAAFDLSLTLAEVAGALTGSLEYCTDLFDEAAAARLARQFTALLAHAVREPHAPVDTLALMDDAERAEVLALADGGQVQTTGSGAGAEPATLHALFVRQAARRPDATAVVHGDRVLSYAEVDRRSDRLAALLRGRFGVRRGDVVGGYLPRHEDAIVAFWAALKAGGGYLPLEPNLPARRLQWMLADARPAVLLTHHVIADRLPASEPAPPSLCLDEPWPAATDASGPVETGPDDLAYVIYTSGSTGRPKGVLVPHRGAPVVAWAEAAAVGFTEHDRLLQYASCAFDVSVEEILVAHLHGATLVITPPRATVPGPKLVRLLDEQRITTLILSPSVLAALPEAELPHPTRLVIGGETLTAELMARWAPGRRLINTYGPTETTICVTLATCRRDGRRPPIGRPIPGAYTYVLDSHQRPVPVGVPGELYIGGAGVAWGYLARPDLTAERFLADPFGPVPGARLYRTGDRVRWLPDGSLDFLGRLDDQVKIRGTRVEPGEVSDRLRELLGTGEVAVVPRPSPTGDTELVAYLVAPGPDRPSVAELRTRLRAELPEPWVPAAFVYLDALPLNTSHKLDRRALPPPTPADRGVSTRLAPRTELERLVAQVWAEILGVADVGVRDHFFDELGGTSLLVARVTSELTDRLGLEVPVTHLFEHPTIEALARRLGEDDQSDDRADHTRPEDRAAGRRAAATRRRRRR